MTGKETLHGSSIRRAGKRPLGWVLAAAAGGCGFLAVEARAVDTMWIAQDGDWSVPANWSTGALPGPGDAAILNFTGVGTPTAHVTTAIGPNPDRITVTNNNRLSVEGGLLATNAAGDNGDLGIQIGRGGVGTADVSGGELRTLQANGSGDLHIGRDAGGNGVLNLSGTGVIAPRDIKVGEGAGGIGLLNQTGGTATIGGPGGGWAFVGLAGGTGTYNMSGGTINATPGPTDRRFFVGIDAGSTGTFVVSGNAVIDLPRTGLVAGEAPGATGNVHIDGGTNKFGWGQIGSRGTGHYRQTAGSMEMLFEFNVGRDPGGVGTFEMTGGSIVTGTFTEGDEAFYVGRGATGTFTMSGGTINTPSAFMVSSEEGGRLGSGTATQTGGTITSGSWVSIGQNNTATYNLSGGSLIATQDFNVADVTFDPDGAGPLPPTAYTGTLNLSGTGVAQGNTVFVGKAALTTGIVNQTGGTFRVGTGGLTIASAAGSFGTYNLDGGVLDMQGNDMRFGAGTGAFVMTGGTLQGADAISFPINQAGGTLHPSGVDGGVGTTTINANYTQAPAATLLIDLGTGTASDVLDVNGAATIGGLLSLNVLDDSQIPVGTQFTILTPDALSGVFLNGGTLVADTGQPFSISYTGGDGNDVVITAEVPEPGTLGVITLALAGLLGARRPRRGARA